MIRAFGRAHYVRYDESTASQLPEMAALANEKYSGDLRRLAEMADDVTSAARLLKEFNGIGEIGADIFLREVQDVWTWARPGLSGEPDKVAVLAESLAPVGFNS
jgi:hypothetical protein